MATKKIAPKTETQPISIEAAVDRLFSFCKENKINFYVTPDNITLEENDDYEELGSWDSVEEFKKNYTKAMDKFKLIDLCRTIYEDGELDGNLPKLKEIVGRLSK